MLFSKNFFFVVISTVMFLGGCTTSNFDGDNGANTAKVFYPIEQMSTEVIADPSSSYLLDSETTSTLVDEKSDTQSDKQISSVELPSNAVDLFPASVAGVWNLSVGGKICRIATPQTKFGQGYRAAPLHCPGIISQVKSWNIRGKKLYFYSNAGRVIASFYSFNVDRFEGRTLDDRPVFLSR